QLALNCASDWVEIPGTLLRFPPRLDVALTPSCGSRLARACWTRARACRCLDAATSRFGLLTCARSISVTSIGSGNARHQSASVAVDPPWGNGARQNAGRSTLTGSGRGVLAQAASNSASPQDAHREGEREVMAWPSVSVGK